MTVLDFYTLDLTMLVIILLITLVVFMILNYESQDKDSSFAFNISVSAISGILVSVLYSYITIEPDEILKTNYWD